MNRCRPVPDSVLYQADDFLLLEGVYYHLFRLFGSEFTPAKKLEERLDIPECAKVGWHLWVFVIEISGGGIPDFLMNHCHSAEQLISTHRALQTIQADGMLILLEASIPLVRESAKEYGEFSDFPRHEWIDQFQVHPAWPDLEAISKSERSWSEAALPLTKLAANFLRAHRSELQQK